MMLAPPTGAFGLPVFDDEICDEAMADEVDDQVGCFLTKAVIDFDPPATSEPLLTGRDDVPAYIHSHRISPYGNQVRPPWP
jgi:hypothetical protein